MGSWLVSASKAGLDLLRRTLKSRISLFRAFVDMVRVDM